MHSTHHSDNGHEAAPRRVAVVTDSATALTPRMARDAGLYVAPMQITIGDRTYADGPEGVAGKFYDLLKSAPSTPKTSAPRPATWLEEFRRAARDADSIVCVTLSANLSAAFDSARVAMDLARPELPDIDFRLVDSRSAAGGEALVALAAARAAAQGRDADAVERAARYVVSRVRLLAYLDTLEYVWRSGRVPRVTVWATSLLNVKPVMEFTRGQVSNLGRPRSRRKAMQRMLTEMARSVGALPVHVNVMHADALEEAQLLRARIERDFECAELHLTQFAAFMGAHTGPGLVGVAFWAQDE